MNHYLVECCANSVQSAINGGEGGANRIELCADLELGGLTPKRDDILKANAEIVIENKSLIFPKIDQLIAKFEMDAVVRIQQGRWLIQ